MNGQQIYEGDRISVKPTLFGSSQSLLSVLVKGAQSEFNKLPDGEYSYLVYSMIVDASGRVVYYTTSPVRLKSGKNTTMVIAVPEMTGAPTSNTAR